MGQNCIIGLPRQLLTTHFFSGFGDEHLMHIKCSDVEWYYTRFQLSLIHMNYQKVTKRE